MHWRCNKRRFAPGLDGLEPRNLLAGSVTQSGAVVTIMPDPAAPRNDVHIFTPLHNGVPMLDVQLNGGDNYFDVRQVFFVQFNGQGLSTDESFDDDAYLSVYAFGGNGNNVFTGGYGTDTFVGGGGTNTFNGGDGSTTMVGGSGSNVFNEGTGSGLILEIGGTNTVNGTNPNYYVY